MTRKTLTARVQQDFQNLGKTLQRLVGDATNVALDATENTLAKAQKKLQQVRAQLKKPSA